MRYVIVGAGAVGGGFGGLMLSAGIPAVLVVKPSQADEWRNGVSIDYGGLSVAIKNNPATTLTGLKPEDGDVVIIATKSQATASVVEDLLPIYGSGVPLICFQNGVRNEETAHRRLNGVYGAMLIVDAVRLEPGVITFGSGGAVVAGRYPAGVDEITRQLCADLQSIRLAAYQSSDIMAVKWANSF
jgi:2-dehydropantoate 2-reductase